MRIKQEDERRVVENLSLELARSHSGALVTWTGLRKELSYRDSKLLVKVATYNERKRKWHFGILVDDMAWQSNFLSVNSFPGRLS